MARVSSPLVTIAPLDRLDGNLKGVASINEDSHVSIKKATISFEVVKTMGEIIHTTVSTGMLMQEKGEL